MSYTFKSNNKVLKFGSHILGIKTNVTGIIKQLNPIIESGANDICYDAPNKRLLITTNNSVLVYETENYTLTDTITGFSRCTTICKDPLNNRFVVHDRNDEVLYPIDYTTLVKGPSFFSTGFAPNGVAYSKAGDIIVFTDNGVSIYFYDAVDFSLLGSHFLSISGVGVNKYSVDRDNPNLIRTFNNQAYIGLIDLTDFTIAKEELGSAVFYMANDPNPSSPYLWVTGNSQYIARADNYGVISNINTAIYRAVKFIPDPVLINDRAFCLGISGEVWVSTTLKK